MRTPESALHLYPALGAEPLPTAAPQDRRSCEFELPSWFPLRTSLLVRLAETPQSFFPVLSTLCACFHGFLDLSLATKTTLIHNELAMIQENSCLEDAFWRKLFRGYRSCGMSVQPMAQ